VATAETARMYKRAARKAILAVVLVFVLSIVVLHNEGYGLFIGGGATGETRNSLALLSCRYFTGTETIISRTWGNAEGAKSGCSWMKKLATPRDEMSGFPPLEPN